MPPTVQDPRFARTSFCAGPVTPEYPPILMIHGTEDTDVPYEESAAMARELARHGVEHELITVPNGGHGLGGADKKLIADAHAKALEFVKHHLH